VTARSTSAPIRTRLDRLRHDFGQLDQYSAIAGIWRLAESGLDETQIVKATSWSLVDVRRVLGDRR
jgi:hypothetical protein